MGDAGGCPPCRIKFFFEKGHYDRYEHLPIYKKAFDLAVHFEKVATGFSRYHKYTLATELRNRSREIVLLIIRANSSRDKTPHLMQLRNDLEE